MKIHEESFYEALIDVNIKIKDTNTCVRLLNEEGGADEIVWIHLNFKQTNTPKMAKR